MATFEETISKLEAEIAEGFMLGDAVETDAPATVDWRDAAGKPTDFKTFAANFADNPGVVGEIATMHRPGATIESDDSGFATDAKLAKAAAFDVQVEGEKVADFECCAPSLPLYDVQNTMSTAGLFALPAVNIARAGIISTTGLCPSDIAQAAGWNYTNAQACAGLYGTDANGVGNNTAGNKPCFQPPCPPFIETKLDPVGACVKFNLLDTRAYPEYVADVLAKVTIGHEFRLANYALSQVIAGSTHETVVAASGPGVSVLLDAIARYVELVQQKSFTRAPVRVDLPFIARDIIRADLANRPGWDSVAYPDSRIDALIRERGGIPNYVAESSLGLLDDTGAYPANIQFNAYLPGTWVLGRRNIARFNNIVDSASLGQNQITSLFLEDGALVAKRLCYSYNVTVPVCISGTVGAHAMLECATGTNP